MIVSSSSFQWYIRVSKFNSVYSVWVTTATTITSAKILSKRASQKSGLASQAGHFKNEILVFPEILLKPITALHPI